MAGKGDPTRRRQCRHRTASKISLVIFFLAYVSMGAYVFLLIETAQGPGGLLQHTPPTEEIRTAYEPPPPPPVVDQDQYEPMRGLVLDKLW